MQNVLTEGWLYVTLFQMQTILFKNVYGSSITVDVIHVSNKTG